ncbi:MAG TPA: twin-arginine translocase subunit TatC [Candidatus Latescibacteria bacterium]|nr:twin-arginine translocase subunit TatC [Candidatus Latescibacterota bacterium]
MPGQRADERKVMSFLDHLEELRWRILKSIIALVLASGVGVAFSDRLIGLLVLPLRRLDPPPKLIFLKPVGMFVVRIEAALLVGAVLASPVVLYQAWRFIAPGLLEHERKAFPLAVVTATGCFLAGVAMAYWAVLPIALRFLVGLGTEYVQAQFDIGRYIGFLLRLCLGFGLVFELPVFSYFLTKLGVLTPGFLQRNRRYAVVGVVALAALLTPPDVASQLLMAGPLLLLYEVSIWVSKLAGRGRKGLERG